MRVAFHVARLCHSKARIITQDVSRMVCGAFSYLLVYRAPPLDSQSFAVSTKQMASVLVFADVVVFVKVTEEEHLTGTYSLDKTWARRQ
jgi:hypothetical protein